MQDSSITRDELMASFQALQRQFDQQKNDIQVREVAFDRLRGVFAQQLSQRGKTLDKVIGQDNPLQPLAQHLTDQLDRTFQMWERQVASRAKGTRFRQKSGDSLLVFIYGKVKSGKSSLGNFMAWGYSEPSPDQKSGRLQPEYFSEERTDVAGGDQEGEAEQAREFRVNATEATSSIQGFRLPGLTWVDSPGLHSVNASNGELAREYVDHADLIVYAMNSQAPGRASDLKEIATLLDRGKKIMVLLTGSDTTDDDEDEAGEPIRRVVMKALSDRNDQIGYVQGELEKLNNSASVLARVLPVSVLYAELNPTPEGISESGMGELLHRLRMLCSGPALAIKLNTPMNNLRQSIRQTAGDLAGVREVLDGFTASIAKQGDELQRELSSLGLQGASEMRAFINELFSKPRNDAELDSALRQKASEVLARLTNEAFGKIGESQQQGLKQAFDGSRLGKLPEYQEVIEEKEVFLGARKGTKGLFGLAGALIGGVAGFFIAGPAGAAAGLSLGGSASIAGRSASAEYGRHQVVVGDNREDQRQAAVEHYSSRLPELLAEHVNTLNQPLRSALLDFCEGLKRDIATLMNQLEQLAQVDR